MATLTSNNLFSTKGPWLNQCINSHRIDISRASSILSEKLNAVFPDNESATKFVEALQSHAESSFSEHMKASPACRLPSKRWMDDYSPGDKQTPADTKSWLLQDLTPLVLLDYMLFALDPSLQHAPLVSRVRSELPGGDCRANQHLKRWADWHKLLKGAAKKYENYTTKARKRTTAVKGAKGDYISRMQKNQGTGAGEKVLTCIQHIAFIIGFYLDGRRKWTVEAASAFCKIDAARHGYKLSDTEVEKIVGGKINLNFLLSTIWWAMGHSCLTILADESEFKSESTARPLHLLEVWKISGNRWRLNTEHPAPPIERLWWSLLLEVSAGQCTPDSAYTKFFENALVQQVLQVQAPNPAYREYLGYQEEVPLEVIDVDTDELIILPDVSPPVQPSRSPSPADLPSPRKKAKVDHPVGDSAELMTPRVLRTAEELKPAPSFTAVIPAAAAPLTRKKVASRGTVAPAQTRDFTPDESPEPLDSLEPNGLVHLFDSGSWLAENTTERENVDLLLANGKQLVDESRPNGKQHVKFTVYCPSANRDDAPIRREYNYPVFDNAAFDFDTLTEMLATEVISSDGLPLHCQASARVLDPKIRPSTTQSLVAVCTKTEWLALSAADQQELQSNRCVLILESGTEPPVPFTSETLERFRDMDTKIELQDCGLRTDSNEDAIRVGTLSDLLNNTPLRGKPIINSLQNPQAYQQIPLPPGWTQTTDLPDCPLPYMSWEDLRWVIIANLHAKSPSHQDILSTVIEVICGWKIWMVTSRVALPDKDHRGDFRTRFAFNSYTSRSSNKEYLRWEFILLGPNMHLIQTADTIHSVISIEDCIAWGFHYHCIRSISRGLSCSLHNVFTARSTTNADHVTARALFVRIFLFQAKNILKGAKPLHVLDLTQKSQLFDLVYLMSVMVLYTAFDTTGYESIEAGQLPMHKDRFGELMCAWGFVVDLLHHLEDRVLITDDNFPTFKSLFEAAIVHMASCAMRYRQDWRDAFHGTNFTTSTLKQQLDLALAAFEAFSKHRNLDKYNPTRLKRSALVRLFQASTTKVEDFTFFLPWTGESFPCTMASDIE
ncbi:hypothetical protein C8R43DRAFT_963396 [Mycena crocata]|nr:hypothetical protein C8R43DRAFT_963396 [Mycena crocata]